MESARPSSKQEQIITRLGPIVEGLGYEVVHLELLVGRQNLIRLFIDRKIQSAAADPGSADSNAAIGVEDCAAVSRALDEPLDQFPEIAETFKGAYELEVSSPGIDRPLRRSTDYSRFTGRQVRMHVYRPLTADELSNSEFQKKHPKQKNFFGTILGFQPAPGSADTGRVQLRLEVEPENRPKGRKIKPDSGIAEVTVPLELISKANLEPQIDWDRKEST